MAQSWPLCWFLHFYVNLALQVSSIFLLSDLFFIAQTLGWTISCTFIMLRIISQNCNTLKALYSWKINDRLFNSRCIISGLEFSAISINVQCSMCTTIDWYEADYVLYEVNNILKSNDTSQVRSDAMCTSKTFKNPKLNCLQLIKI